MAGGIENAGARETTGGAGVGEATAIAVGAAAGPNGSGATDGGLAWGGTGLTRSATAGSSRSAVASRDMIGTTLLRGIGDGRERGGGSREPAAPVGGSRTFDRAGGGGGMLLTRTSPGGGRDNRLIASRTLAASSGNNRSGRHSSSPSCQTSDSSLTAPSAAFRRTSATRIGPTGTPLMATYHSSLGARSAMSKGIDVSSSCDGPRPRRGPSGAVDSCCTALLNAPSSAPAGLGAAGAGAAAPAGLALGGSGRGAAGAGSWLGRSPPGKADDTLVSVTAARTSMRWPHLRHFIRTVLPTAFSSEIWYLALHCSQRNFTRLSRPWSETSI